MLRPILAFGRDFITLIDWRSLRLGALLVTLLLLPIMGAAPRGTSSLDVAALIVAGALIATYVVPMIVFVLWAWAKYLRRRQALDEFLASSEYDELRQSFSDMYDML